MALIHIDRPKNLTESAATPNSPLLKCEVLYEKNKSGIYEFAGLYDPDIPDEEYPDGMAAFSFRSVYVDTVTINRGTHVWNVKGSTGDKWGGKVCHNWLGVWYEVTECKVSKEVLPCYVAGSKKTDGSTGCKGDIIGGHMALTATTVNPDENDYIYIIPICKSHNYFGNIAQMTVTHDVKAIQMNKFKQ